EVAGWDASPHRIERARAEIPDFVAAAGLEAGLARRPHAVLVCTPPATPVVIARQAGEGRCYRGLCEPGGANRPGGPAARRRRQARQPAPRRRAQPALSPESPPREDAAGGAAHRTRLFGARQLRLLPAVVARWAGLYGHLLGERGTGRRRPPRPRSRARLSGMASRRGGGALVRHRSRERAGRRYGGPRRADRALRLRRDRPGSSRLSPLRLPSRPRDRRGGGGCHLAAYLAWRAGGWGRAPTRP